MGQGYHSEVNSKEAFIALNMIDHVGPVRVRQLLDAFGTPHSALRIPHSAFDQSLLTSAPTRWGRQKLPLTLELIPADDLGLP